MAQAQAVRITKEVEAAAIRAVYELQYNSIAAAKFVTVEVPSTPFDVAVQAINKVVRPSKKYRAKR